MQHEIKHSIPLLDEKGELTEAGYAKRLLPVYDRAKVRSGAARLKEWDDYLVMGQGFALALTIADNSYMGLDSISLMDFAKGWRTTRRPLRPRTMGPTGLPQTSARGNAAAVGQGYGILFHNDGVNRTLTVHMDRFWEGEDLDAHVVLRDVPEESAVVCAPFHQPGCFCLSQKIVGMRADGVITLGNKRYDFNLQDSFAILNWGRGAWSQAKPGFWGGACGTLDGAVVGFNIGSGFGDAWAAAENMLFYGGKAHKLTGVSVQLPPRESRDDVPSPWTFTSGDGRFEMTFAPLPDQSAHAGGKRGKPTRRQIFGRFTGTAVLDGGGALEVRDLMGFVEKAEPRW